MAILLFNVLTIKKQINFKILIKNHLICEIGLFCLLTPNYSVFHPNWTISRISSHNFSLKVVFLFQSFLFITVPCRSNKQPIQQCSSSRRCQKKRLLEEKTARDLQTDKPQSILIKVVKH